MTDDDLLITAALDDELDAAASLALQRRLDQEPALKAKWDEQRALRDAVRAKASYHTAPDDLRLRLDELLAASRDTAPRRGVPGRLDDGAPRPRTSRDADASDSIDRVESLGAFADLGESRRPHPRRRPRHELAMRRPARPWGYAAGGAIAAMVLTLAVVDPGTLHLPGHGLRGDERVVALADDEAAAEAVSAHTRALLVDHPIEVVSSDQHTVRPWLSARLNFVPPVADFAAQGFTLLGARRDVLSGETSAALVYRHGAHVISVFVRPQSGGAAQAAADAPPTLSVVRGFNVLQRAQGGMAFCLVSDMNAKELATLSDLLVRQGTSDEPKGPMTAAPAS